MIIILRKLSISCTGLLFRDNPAFQMALLLLLLFAFFCLQILHRPFMSPSEKNEVIQNHIDKAENIGDVDEKQVILHQQIRNRIRKHQIQHDTNVHVASFNDSNEHSDLAFKYINTYIFDYNTVEACLLSCSIFVCTGGIMFESDRFKDKKEMDWQRDTITYFIIIVISFSMVYFFTVLYFEIFSNYSIDVLPRWIRKCLGVASKNNITELTSSDNHELIPKDHDISTNINPLIAYNNSNQRKKEKDEIRLKTKILQQETQDIKSYQGKIEEIKHKNERRKGSFTSINTSKDEPKFYNDETL